MTELTDWKMFLSKVITGVENLEGIQKRAYWIVIELRSMKYEERLEVLGLTTLELRRKKGT